MAFIRAPLLAQKRDFDRYIVKPILKRRTECFMPLRDLIMATCIRRTKASCILTLSLPRKQEFVNYVELNMKEREIYTFFQRRSYALAAEQEASPHAKSLKASDTLQLIGVLRLICNHAEGLLPDAALDAWEKKNSNALSWDALEANIKQCDFCSSGFGLGDAAESLGFVCQHKICSHCIAVAREDVDRRSPILCPVCSASVRESPSVESQDIRPKRTCSPSTKILALLENISLQGHLGEEAPIKWYG